MAVFVERVLEDQLWVTYRGYYKIEDVVQIYKAAAQQYNHEPIRLLVVNMMATRKAVTQPQMIEILKAKNQLVPLAHRILLYSPGPLSQTIELAKQLQQVTVFRSDEIHQFIQWLYQFYLNHGTIIKQAMARDLARTFIESAHRLTDYIVGDPKSDNREWNTLKSCLEGCPYPGGTPGSQRIDCSHANTCAHGIELPTVRHQTGESENDDRNISGEAAEGTGGRGGTAGAESVEDVAGDPGVRYLHGDQGDPRHLEEAVQGGCEV